MNTLAIFFGSLIITLFVTPFYINYLINTRVVDEPGERRINKTIIPRMGGLIIFLTALLMTLSFANDLNNLRFFIIAAFTIMFCGLFDDILGLKWQSKFILQGLAAALMLAYFSKHFQQIKLFEITLPFPLDYLIFFVFIVGVINSINLLDGLDGLVSGVSLLALSIVFALSFNAGDQIIIVLSASLMGSLFGFLKYNAYPARIFLGDTGSLSLGFFLVYSLCSVSIKLNDAILDLTLPTIILSVPIIDTLRVMISRIARRQNPFHPDKTHLHHVILQSNISHKTTVFLIEGYTLFFAMLALTYAMYDKSMSLIIYFILALPLIFIQKLSEIVAIIRKIDIAFNVAKKLFSLIAIFFRKSLMLISSLIIFLLILSVIPIKTSFYKEQILILLFVGIVLFFIAISQRRNSTLTNDVYALLNFTMFFIIARASAPFSIHFKSLNFLNGHTSDILLYLLVGIIFLFLIAKEKIFENKDIFLTGIDLTSIAVIALLFILNNFLKMNLIEHLSKSFIFGFVFYMWYKVVKSIRKESENYLLYFSFALPGATLLMLLSLS